MGISLKELQVSNVEEFKCTYAEDLSRRDC